MKHGRAFIDGGFRPVFVKEGHKWNQVVYIDGSRVRVKRTKQRVETKPMSLSMKKMAFIFLRKTNILGTKMTITKTAKHILREAVEQGE